MDYLIASYDSELYHYGVKGMKWGVRRYQNADGSLTAAGKKRDEKLLVKAIGNSALAFNNAYEAQQYAKGGNNGSKKLARSDRYLKKANKIANKMSDGGERVRSGATYQLATMQNKKAGESYVKRSAAKRVATFATTAAVSAGASFVAFNMGAPIGVVYATTGGKYELKR